MRFLLLTALVTVFVGCGGSVAIEPGDGGLDGNSETSIASDGDRPDSRPMPIDAARDAVVIDDGPIVPGECHSLANTAPVVTTRSTSGSSPPSIGGAIVPGLYHMTDATFFSSTTMLPPMSLRLTIRIVSGRFETAQSSEGGESDQTSSTYSVSGTTVTLAQTCPDFESATMRYSATPTSVILYFDVNEDGLRGTFRYTLTRVS